MVRTTQLLMALLLTLGPHDCSCCQSPAFTRIVGFDCVDPSFTLTRPGVTTVEECAISCHNIPDCLAFAFARPLCRQFVFGRNSRRVRASGGCVATSDIFVRELPNAPSGRLCGPGFGHDYRGTKYALKYTQKNWQSAKTQCESMGGLAQLAELVDKPEMDNAATIDGGSWSNRPVWLAGYQIPGSPEPAGGCFWMNSGLPVNMSTALWNTADPDNDAAQNRICLHETSKLYNDRENSQQYYYLCQCVSPFD